MILNELFAGPLPKPTQIWQKRGQDITRTAEAPKFRTRSEQPEAKTERKETHGRDQQ